MELLKESNNLHIWVALCGARGGTALQAGGVIAVFH